MEFNVLWFLFNSESEILWINVMHRAIRVLKCVITKLKCVFCLTTASMNI